jgi:hypothetical protein
VVRLRRSLFKDLERFVEGATGSRAAAQAKIEETRRSAFPFGKGNIIPNMSSAAAASSNSNNSADTSAAAAGSRASRTLARSNANADAAATAAAASAAAMSGVGGGAGASRSSLKPNWRHSRRISGGNGNGNSNGLESNASLHTHSGLWSEGGTGGTGGVQQGFIAELLASGDGEEDDDTTTTGMHAGTAGTHLKLCTRSIESVLLCVCAVVYKLLKQLRAHLKPLMLSFTFALLHAAPKAYT